MRAEICGVFERKVEHIGICLEFRDCGDSWIGGRRGVGVQEPSVRWYYAMETEEDSDVGEFGGEGLETGGQRGGCC